MTAGRPLKYKTQEELQDAIDDYFINAEIPTITGLALHLGFCSRQSMYDYEKTDGFADIIKLARKRINPPCNKRKYNYKLSYSPTSRVKERRELDVAYRLRTNFSSLLRAHLRKNGDHVFDIVGYSVHDLKKHLENKFEDGMSWDNYGKWHIDHIIPASSFKYRSYEDIEFKECWSLENLQPLWALDNIKKGAKLKNLVI
jgi:hypothetical protein